MIRSQSIKRFEAFEESLLRKFIKNNKDLTSTKLLHLINRLHTKAQQLHLDYTLQVFTTPIKDKRDYTIFDNNYAHEYSADSDLVIIPPIDINHQFITLYGNYTI